MTEPGAPGTCVNPSGEFTRDSNDIATRITADGRDGLPGEPGRYRLVVSRARPWANRAIIVRRLAGWRACCRGPAGIVRIGGRSR